MLLLFRLAWLGESRRALRIMFGLSGEEDGDERTLVFVLVDELFRMLAALAALFNRMLFTFETLPLLLLIRLAQLLLLLLLLLLVET